MIFYTLQDALNEIKLVVDGGACNSSTVVTRINQATRRLLNRPRKPVHVRRVIRFFTRKDTITLPREVEKILHYTVDTVPAPLFSPAYEFVSGGWGELGCRTCFPGALLVDCGNQHPTMFDIPSMECFSNCDPEPVFSGLRLLAFSTAEEDRHKELRLFGLNDRNEALMTPDPFASSPGIRFVDERRTGSALVGNRGSVLLSETPVAPAALQVTLNSGVLRLGADYTVEGRKVLLLFPVRADDTVAFVYAAASDAASGLVFPDDLEFVEESVQASTLTGNACTLTRFPVSAPAVQLALNSGVQTLNKDFSVNPADRRVELKFVPKPDDVLQFRYLGVREERSLPRLFTSQPREGEPLPIQYWSGGIEGESTLDEELGEAGLPLSGPVRDLTRVLKPPTSGFVSLYTYDPATHQMYFLAKYHPHEINPRYRRYRIAGFDPSRGRSVYALCELGYIPLSHPDDILIVQNVDAVKLMVMAIEMENQRDFQLAKAYEADAYRLIEDQRTSERTHDYNLIQVSGCYGFGDVRRA